MLSVLVTATLATLASPLDDGRRGDGPFAQRGYYITFIRMPTHNLGDWRPIYPHYFSGVEVPGSGVRAARQTFGPRWTLFFTPHSAHLEDPGR
jgi:hypothetical protein